MIWSSIIQLSTEFEFRFWLFEFEVLKFNFVLLLCYFSASIGIKGVNTLIDGTFKTKVSAKADVILGKKMFSRNFWHFEIFDFENKRTLLYSYSWFFVVGSPRFFFKNLELDMQTLVNHWRRQCLLYEFGEETGCLIQPLFSITIYKQTYKLIYIINTG